jgi:hypothetical protein
VIDAKTDHSVDLWIEPDGTLCRLSELVEAPKFELLLLRSGNILRCRRLHSPAAAHALATTWKEDQEKD